MSASYLSSPHILLNEGGRPLDFRKSCLELQIPLRLAFEVLLIVHCFHNVS